LWKLGEGKEHVFCKKTEKEGQRERHGKAGTGRTVWQKKWDASLCGGVKLNHAFGRQRENSDQRVEGRGEKRVTGK